MTAYDFRSPAKSERDIITFGTPEKTVTIDATFIPASTAYRMMKLLVKDPETNRYPDDVYASIIALFTTEADAAWIVENTRYLTLDSIVAILIGKAFEKPPEKN